MADAAFEHVFHPSDFSEASDIAFDHALKIALAAKRDLTIVHVTSDPSSVEGQHFPSVRDTLTRWKVIPPGGSTKHIVKTGLRVKKVKLSGNDPVRAIKQRLNKKPANLIVLANRGQDNRPRWMNKTVSEPIARDTQTMTLFLPHGVRGFVNHQNGDVSLRRVLMPVDHTPNPQHSILTSLELVTILDCHNVIFNLVHVGARTHLPNPKLPSGDRWSWRLLVRDGDAVSDILDVANNMVADLIVLTTQGHNGFLDALRGSTTERVVRAAHCPVLAVPASEYLFP